MSVSAQPGKTKHLQTIPIEREGVSLCDCPGLVFPSFTNSRAEMVCAGVISIDHITDFDTPMILVVKRIPRWILQQVYNIRLPEEKTYMSPNMFLQYLARERGYVTGSALPDVKKTAKIILKDYVNGKLLYCHLRPDFNPARQSAPEQSGIGEVMDAPEEKVEKDEKKAEETEGKTEAKKEEKSGEKSEEKSEEKPESKKVTEDEVKAPPKPAAKVFVNRTEAQVDSEFFAPMQSAAKSKLTKGQKRQMKFAAKRGEDVSKISLEDIKKRAEKKKKRTPKQVQPQIKPGYRAEGCNRFELLDQ